MDLYTETPTKGYAIGQLIGEAQPPKPFTDLAANQLDHLRKSLADTRTELAMVHDRMFGNPNQTAAGGVPPAPPMPSAHTDLVMALISSCQFEINEISALARGLNGRL